MRIRGTAATVILSIILIAGCAKEIQLTQQAQDWLKEYKKIGMESVDAMEKALVGGENKDPYYQKQVTDLMTTRPDALKGLDKDQLKLFYDEIEKIDDDILMMKSILKRVKEY